MTQAQAMATQQLPPNPRQVTRDMADELFQYAHELAGLGCLHLHLVQGHAEARDVAGMEYAIRRLVAHIKPLIATYNDLSALEREAAKQ